MKKTAVLFAMALTVSLLTSQARAAGLYPVYVVEYTYGPFDELRVDKVYELSQTDDPADIPTEDFDRRGYHYTLLCVVETGQSEANAQGQTATASRDTVIYTATFVCRDEAKTGASPSQVPIKQTQPEKAGSFDPHSLIVLFGMIGLVFGGGFIYQYIKSKKRTGV